MLTKQNNGYRLTCCLNTTTNMGEVLKTPEHFTRENFFKLKHSMGSIKSASMGPFLIVFFISFSKLEMNFLTTR